MATTRKKGSEEKRGGRGAAVQSVSVRGAEGAPALEVLERLSSEVGRAIDTAGLNGAGPRALARSIDADVALCHRVLTGMRATGSASERLRQWPGVEGVQVVATKLSQASGKEELTGPLRLAVDAFAQMVQRYGGTHSKTVRALRQAEVSGGVGSRTSPTEQVASRRALTNAASKTLGYEVGLCSFVSFIRPIPKREELLEGCSAWGLIDLRTHGVDVCVTSQNTQLRGSAGALANEVKWRPLGTPIDGRDGLLTEFCSDPMPLSASDDGDGYIRQMVQPSRMGTRGSADIVMARHWSPDNNPQHMKGTPVWSQIVRMRHPGHRLVFDVYMHKSMLGSTPPSIGAYVWHPALGNDPRKQWHDRLPGSPRIEILPSGQVPTTKAWESQPKVTARLLELVGWPAEEFVGFRCDERFPLWSSAYYMTFELATKRQRGREGK